MKRVMAPVISILLAFSILGAAIGVPLTRHICHMSDILTVNVGAEEHGCEEPASKSCADDQETTVLVDETCCHFSVTHEKADLQSFLKVLDNWSAAAAILPSAALVPVSFQPYFIHEKEALLSASDSSPPLAGRRLLAFISVLTI